MPRLWAEPPGKSKPCRKGRVEPELDPRAANFIFWWPLYRNGDTIHVQNHILFLDDLAQPFDEADIYRAAPHRETKTDEGEPVSEWTIRLSDIEDFVGAEQ